MKRAKKKADQLSVCLPDSYVTVERETADFGRNPDHLCVMIRARGTDKPTCPFPIFTGTEGEVIAFLTGFSACMIEFAEQRVPTGSWYNGKWYDDPMQLAEIVQSQEAAEAEERYRSGP